MRVVKKWSNEDASFSVSMNFSMKDWADYVGKGYVKKAMQDIRLYMKDAVDKRFRRAQSPDGKSWAPLSKITTKYKGSRRKLIFKGRLQRSVRVTVYGNELIVSTKSAYGRTHQKGANFRTTKKQSFWMWHNLFGQKGHPFRPRRIKIPKREFLGFSAKDKLAISKIIIKRAKESERMGKY
jgi:phage gpG-like protein